MHAARAQPGEMPLADQQPGRRGLLLLRERASQRIALLPGARAHCVSVGRSAAQQQPRDAMNSRDSFNHFVRGNEQCLRYCEAERFRGLSRSNIAGPRDARSAFVRLKVDVIVTWGTASVL